MSGLRAKILGKIMEILGKWWEMGMQGRDAGAWGKEIVKDGGNLGK